MVKSILAVLLLCVVVLTCACGFQGDSQLYDQYTRNLYPGANSTYSLGTANLTYRLYAANITATGLPTGANQTAAGARAGEMWVDSSDNWTLKLGQ